MAITLRRRGRAGTWYARGTIRIGRETIHVPEFSTGCRERADAEAVVEHERARLRAEHLEGPAGRARSLTLADCFLAYLRRPGGVARTDTDRIGRLNEAMGHRPLAEAPAAWRDWCAAHPRHSPGTLARWRTVLAAATRHAAAQHATTAPALPPVRQPRSAGRHVPRLAPSERARLLAAYNPHAACPALLLSEQGLRTQECLQIDWRQVRFDPDEIEIRAQDSKSGRGRTVPMTRRVSLLLYGMWHAAGQPESGPVFLSSRGQPYRDTRGNQGGNPLAKAHVTALKAAGINRRFRIHDHRHDWAARQIMGGMDLFSLMRLGGWSSLAMVSDRYGSVTAEHLREAVRRVA
jgi:integrase